MTDTSRARGRPANAVRAAALLYAANGAGFGIGAALTGWYYAHHRELPMTPFGFRSLSGPFESLGSDRFVALIWALVGLCALDVPTGAWLWHGRRRGAEAVSLPRRCRSGSASDSPCRSCSRRCQSGSCSSGWDAEACADDASVGGDGLDRDP